MGSIPVVGKRWKQVHSRGVGQVWGPEASQDGPSFIPHLSEPLDIGPRKAYPWMGSFSAAETNSEKFSFLPPASPTSAAFRARGEGSLGLLELVLEFLSLFRGRALVKTWVNLSFLF